MSKGSYDIVNPSCPVIQERVLVLLSIAKIEMILCYGVRRKQSERWSLFVDESQICESTEIDVLIVIHPSDKHREHELVDRVNRLNTEELRLVSVIHNSDAILDSVASGSSFFRSVLKKAVLIYQRPMFSFSNIAEAPKPVDALLNHWGHHSSLAQNFLSGAEFFIAGAQYDLAAFMMHQSVENLCSAIINDFMGYRVITHNLNRLLSLTENFSPDISGLFHLMKEADRIAFNLLSHAYSQARYNDSFSVSKDQAKDLHDKVVELISIVKELHARKCLLESSEKVLGKLNSGLDS